MIGEHKKLLTENLLSASRRVTRMISPSPLLLYRLGLGPLMGRLFMILIHTQKGGLVCQDSSNIR